MRTFVIIVVSVVAIVYVLSAGKAMLDNAADHIHNNNTVTLVQ